MVKIKKWVNSEVDKQLDKDGFFSLPLRMRIGILMLGISFLAGYGIPIVLVYISNRNHQLSTGLVKGSLIYGFFSIIGYIGLILAGRDCIKYPIYFSAKLLKKVFPNYFRDESTPSENKKDYSAFFNFYLFHLIKMLSLFGILIFMILSAKFSSYRFLILGILLICSIYQAFYIHGMFFAGSNFFFKTVKGKEYYNNQRGILFRFDDGPDPVYTPQVLDILKSEGIQALFAITGKNAEMYPGIVARIHRENHIIANHTYSHPYNILFLGYNRIKHEISRTNSIIQSITGVQPKYFCSPIGHKNPVIGKVIKDLDLIPVMWDIRTLDTRLSFEKIMTRIKRKLKSPAIIMFHDAITPGSKKGGEILVPALKETIRMLKAENYL